MSDSRGIMHRGRPVVRPVAAVLLFSGCFQYVPGSYDPPPAPNSEVRVQLATPRDIPMGEFTLNEVTVIEGMVAEATDDTLAVTARWLRPRVGRRYDAAGATFYLPRSDVASVEDWRLSPKRTLLLGGFVALGMGVFITLGATSLTSGDAQGPPNPTAGLSGPR